MINFTDTDINEIDALLVDGRWVLVEKGSIEAYDTDGIPVINLRERGTRQQIVLDGRFVSAFKLDAD